MLTPAPYLPNVPAADLKTREAARKERSEPQWSALRTHRRAEIERAIRAASVAGFDVHRIPGDLPGCPDDLHGRRAPKAGRTAYMVSRAGTRTEGDGYARFPLWAQIVAPHGAGYGLWGRAFSGGFQLPTFRRPLLTTARSDRNTSGAAALIAFAVNNYAEPQTRPPFEDAPKPVPTVPATVPATDPQTTTEPTA